jgi:tryptophan-rich sensory protein
MHPVEFNRWAGLGFAVIICMGVGLLGAIATRQALVDWYPTLHKPSWNPPEWLFGPVWTALYVMMAIAAWMVWQSRGRSHRLALVLFAVQLACNAIWSPVFFAFHSPGLALIDIAALWIAIIGTIVVFNRSSRTAAILMMPYLGWVSFAASLNFEIWRLNR